MNYYKKERKQSSGDSMNATVVSFASGSTESGEDEERGLLTMETVRLKTVRKKVKPCILVHHFFVDKKN